MADGTLKVGTITTSSGSGNITIGSGVTLNSNTPAFHATVSATQAIAQDTTTLVQFNSEVFDTDNCYDNSTNYRFTPTVAGKYHIYSTVQFKTSGYDMYAGQIYVRKNGSNYLSDRITPNNSSILEAPVTVSTTIDMNGSTDYIEIFGYIERHGGSDDQRFESGLKNSFFGAYKLIGA